MRSSISLLASVAMVSMVEAATHRVDVGLGGLKFVPNSTVADVGDVVEFHFHPKNHNVVQTSFGSPCDYGSFQNPFYSGFMPVATGEGTQVFQVTINTASPIWFYCGQVTHCQQGMVGVINVVGSGPNTLDAFAAAAAKVANSTSPSTVSGGVVAADTSSNSTSSSASTSATATDSSGGYGSAPSTTAGSATGTSSPSATASKAGAVSLQAVGWNELLGMGAIIGGAAILMQ